MNGEPVNFREVRQAQLRAAAEALVVWVHARRLTWSGVPAEVIAVSPSLTPAAPLVSVPSVDDLPAPPVATPAAPAVRPRIARRAFSFEPIVRWSGRVGVAAVLAAIVIGAGWSARTYWLKLKAVPKTGTAVLETVPPGSDVFVDGTAVGKTPLTAELPPGRHVIEFRRRNAARTLDIYVMAGRSTAGRLDWSGKRTGRLAVASEPAGARVLVDGRERGVTPLTLDDLSVGSHAVVLESDRGSVRRTVEVTSDNAAQITESIYPGWLKLFAPFELEVAEGTRGIRLDDENRMLLPPGPHDLRFENRALGYRETRHVEIEPGKIVSMSIASRPSALTVTATQPAEVLIDGERVGDTPLTDHPVALGARDIIVKSAAGAERRFSMTVTVKPVRIDVDFSKP